MNGHDSFGQCVLSGACIFAMVFLLKLHVDTFVEYCTCTHDNNWVCVGAQQPANATQNFQRNVMPAHCYMYRSPPVYIVASSDMQLALLHLHDCYLCLRIVSMQYMR